MVTKLFKKPQAQQVIKDLRAAGYTVTKDKSGKYDCELDGETIFTAMPGHYAYLVRYNERLITEAV
jgi:hypothetical protein